MNARPGLLYGLALIMATACSVSAHVLSDSESQAIDQYKVVWSRNWATITSHEAPLIPSGTSPGVCNKGGTLQGCHDVSVLLAKDYESFAGELSGDWVPANFQRANETIRRAMVLNIDGLRMRAQAIERSDNSLWQQSNTLLAQAIQLYRDGYAQFPPDLRPTPEPNV